MLIFISGNSELVSANLSKGSSKNDVTALGKAEKERESQGLCEDS